MTDRQQVKEKFNEGMRAFVKKNFKEAADRFSDAIQMEPDFALAYLSRGSSFNRMEKEDEAMGDFNKALELKPDYSRAYHLRGLLHEKRNENEKALEDFDHAIDLNPEYGAAYYSRAGLHSKIGNDEEAKEDIEMVTMLTEQNIGAFANENNIWRSHHLRLEAEGIADVMER
jgi:tetratricopeptide (TPR) repeat protein